MLLKIYEANNRAASGLNNLSVFQKVIKNASQIKLPVIALKTNFGTSGSAAPEYPSELTVKVPTDFKNMVSAYGASYEVVVAPKGWTGSGNVGADGNRSVELKPASGAWSDGSKVTLFIASTGTGSALFGAAPYFSWVRDNWKSIATGTAPTEAQMTTTPISSKLLKYTLKNPPQGMVVTGIAYSDAQEHVADRFWSFVQMEITFPQNKSDFADALLNTFIDQHGLTK